MGGDLLLSGEISQRTHVYVYDEASEEVGKDDSPGPRCSVKVTPAKDGKYNFVIKNAGGGQHGDLRGKGRQVMTRRFLADLVGFFTPLDPSRKSSCSRLRVTEVAL